MGRRQISQSHHQYPKFIFNTMWHSLKSSKGPHAYLGLNFLFKMDIFFGRAPIDVRLFQNMIGKLLFVNKSIKNYTIETLGNS